MMSFNKLSFLKKTSKTFLEDPNAIKQIKELKRHLTIYENETTNLSNISNINSPQAKREKIISIISQNLQGTSELFIDSSKNLNIELFIHFLLELLKKKLIKNYHIIKNVDINKAQFDVIQFILAFYDVSEEKLFVNNNYINIINMIINNHNQNNKELEDPFLLSIIKIIFVVHNELGNDFYKDLFQKDINEKNDSLNDLSIVLIKSINSIEFVKRNKKKFFITISDSSCPFNLEPLINIFCQEHEIFIIKLLTEIIIKNNTIITLKELMKNEDILKTLFNNLSHNKEIRKKVIELINQSANLSQDKYKNLLKIIKKNNILTKILDHIGNDLNNNGNISNNMNKNDKNNANRSFIINNLLYEIKIIYKYYLIINIADNYIEQKILTILNNNIDFSCKETVAFYKEGFVSFITDINNLSKTYQKLKFKVYNFLLFIFNSIKGLRKIISDIFLNNFNNDIESYIEMLKNNDFFSLFINNFSSSDSEVLDNFFKLLYSFDKNKYLPRTELKSIIDSLRLITNIDYVHLIIENIKIFTNMNFLQNIKDINDNDDDIFNDYDCNNILNENQKDNCCNKNKDTLSDDEEDYNKERLKKFVFEIHKNFIDIVYFIISDINYNINNSLKYKLSTDMNDISLSKALNLSSSFDNMKSNKSFLSTEILELLLNFLQEIINNNENKNENNNETFTYYESKNFLEIYNSLVNDSYYQEIAYKIIEIYLNFSKNKEQNVEQIIIILNRFDTLLSTTVFTQEDSSFNASSNDNINNISSNYSEEIGKLKEFLLMYNTIKITFTKEILPIKSIRKYTKQKIDNMKINFNKTNSNSNSNDNNNNPNVIQLKALNERIINFYLAYLDYINTNFSHIYKIYDTNYHELFKQYLNILLDLFYISNKNTITKSNLKSPILLNKHIKNLFTSVIRFYAFFPNDNDDMHFLDIIKFFIDKSLDLKPSGNQEENNKEILFEDKLSKNDFSSYYINKYEISNDDIYFDTDKSKSNYSNFFIQSPMIIILLLQSLYSFNRYLGEFLSFILFLCNLNDSNIKFLLKQKLIEILFKISIEMPKHNKLIQQILKLSFKYLQKEELKLILEQTIKLANNISNVNCNDEFIKIVLHNLTKTLHTVSLSENEFCKGILLSGYKIRQPNIYNLVNITNISLVNKDENEMETIDGNEIENEKGCHSDKIIIFHQQICFYKQVKAKKLLLLRIETEKDKDKNCNNKNNLMTNNNSSEYIEVSMCNSNITVNENDYSIKYNDLSNYNSIFIDNNDDFISNSIDYIKINDINAFIYIFNQSKNILSIYINGKKLLNYKYKFQFKESINASIGFPLDLVKEVYDDKYISFDHIKLKSLKIYLKDPDTIEIDKMIYQLIINNQITCEYLFVDDLTNFKINPNTNLISKYNNLSTAIKNCIFRRHDIKSQFYQKIFFTENYLTNTLDYTFRLEKYIFILLNNENIDRDIFKELLALLSSYLMLNSSFLSKFLYKEEFMTTLYFSLLRNAKYINKEIIDILFSIILTKDNIDYRIIIDLLLDNKLFSLIDKEAKYDILDIIKSKIINDDINYSLNYNIIDKLSKLLILCTFESNDEHIDNNNNIINNITINDRKEIDEELIDIIMDIYDKHYKDSKLSLAIEELFYILFNFESFAYNHITKYNQGRFEDSYNVIYAYFNKIYCDSIIVDIKDMIIKKLESLINLDINTKSKLFRLANAYKVPKKHSNFDEKQIDEADEVNIDDDEEENNNFRLPYCRLRKMRSISMRFKESHIKKKKKEPSNNPINTDKNKNNITLLSANKANNDDMDYSKEKSIDFSEPNRAGSFIQDINNNLNQSINSNIIPNCKYDNILSSQSSQIISRISNYDITDYAMKIQSKNKKSSIRPIDDIVIYTGTIEGEVNNNKEVNNSINIFQKKKKIEKRKSKININITEEDNIVCTGKCVLCSFIRKIILLMFQREINFEIYKNYILHCMSEITIINHNLDFELSFSYHLMRKEGPSRIRKKFELRVDKLINSEYDRTVEICRKTKRENSHTIKDNFLREKSISISYELNREKQYEKQNAFYNYFKFFEKTQKFSDNLINFFNLGQIFNIDILPDIISNNNDLFQGACNCLIFKGLTYKNGVFIIGKEKIYILSDVNLSLNSILYSVDQPIKKTFWVVNQYNDILSNQCKYLNLYDQFIKRDNITIDTSINIINNSNSSINNNNHNNHNHNTSKKKVFEKNKKGFWLYSFSYIEINELHKKKFLHQNNAIEIFLKNGKSYYLAFNIDIRDKIVRKILQLINQNNTNRNNHSIINNQELDSIIINNNNINERQNQKNNEEIILVSSSSSSSTINEKNNANFEIYNESSTSIKNENMIFLKNSNIFQNKAKKYPHFSFYKTTKGIIIKNKFKSKSPSIITDSKEIFEHALDKWTTGQLDTFSYLMILNTISGRTYNDMSQYPIFPWILKDYSSKEIDLNKSETYRELMYPIYAQEDEVRENLKMKYEAFEETDSKFHSGSHYSTCGFVCYYLIRIKPFSSIAAEVQGEFFDTTDRLFLGVEAFYNVNEKYQELIPEVFNIPEIFININNFDFGLTSDGKNIDNVILPPWASHSPRLFCKMFKKSLESQYVSQHINDWIDLIFGYKQKGAEGEKCFNILRQVCSGFNPKKDCDDEIEMEQKINLIVEMGINPNQLFNKPHHRRDKHQKMKAFFGRQIFLTNFKTKNEKYRIENFNNFSSIKEIYKYYEYPSDYISSGEGGLSSFRMCYEDETSSDKKKIEDNKDNNNIYFIIGGKKTLIPPSYKNFIEWGDRNIFNIIKPFHNKKYTFTIQHMKKHTIQYIKMTSDGKFIIIGYANGTIEKYKLFRIWGPKIKKRKVSAMPVQPIQTRMNPFRQTVNSKTALHLLKNKNNEKKKKKNSVSGGLFQTLFGDVLKQKNNNNNDSNNKNKNNGNFEEINKKNKEEEEIDLDNKEIIKQIENNNIVINDDLSLSNKLLFDTQIPISTSNILNSDCILLNKKTGKFIQYDGIPSIYNNSLNNNINNLDIPGYYAHCINNSDLNHLSKKIIFENNNNDNNPHSIPSKKQYYIFLVNSSNRILSDIALIDICEPYSFMLVVDKNNRLYLYDLNSFDLLKYIDCSSNFQRKIKFSSICPYSGDFIVASSNSVLLMNINGVILTQMNDIKSKINSCFITSIHQTQSDIFLFTAHEDGYLLISKLVNNLSGYIFNNNSVSELLTSTNINMLNNKYDPNKINNIQQAYHDCLDISNSETNNNNIIDKKINKSKYNDNNNLSLIFDTLIKIQCSKYPIKYIKLSQDQTTLLCINANNKLAYMNYEEFYNVKKKNKDKKNVIICPVCQNAISSSKVLCHLCGRKLCPNCKKEVIIAEYSLKNPKSICDDCSQLINLSNKSLYDF